jgi:hypothetical protein
MFHWAPFLFETSLSLETVFSEGQRCPTLQRCKENKK